ncbi:hypothetical protein ACA910_022219 [Epithemia clementina (nom. ined.)]
MFHLNYPTGFPENHVVRIASKVLQQEVTLGYFQEQEDAVRTTIPWKDHVHHFSGIPPKVAALHDLMVVQDEQHLLVDKFIDKMHLLLDECGIKGGHLTVQMLQEILGQGLNKIRLWLDEIDAGRLPLGAHDQEVVQDLGQPINNST